MATDPARITTPERQHEDADAALAPVARRVVGKKGARVTSTCTPTAARRGFRQVCYSTPGASQDHARRILAREMGSVRATGGDRQVGRSRALLTISRTRRAVIDEIHSLSPAVEEILYPAMRTALTMIGRLRAERAHRPAQVTLVGATTRAGHHGDPVRDRFGIPIRLNFYTVAELEQVVRRAAKLLNAPSPRRRHEVARRSRGTPRIAGRLLRRVRDFAHAAGADHIDAAAADRALSRLEIDSLGLDAMDRRYLTMIADLYNGGPVGVETLAAGLSEPRDTIEDVIEPYMIQLGLIARTARGRCLNAAAEPPRLAPPPAQTACSTRSRSE